MNGGLGSGEYVPGDEVEIEAKAPEEKEFIAWIGGGESIDDSTQIKATITMPNRELQVNALFEEEASAIEQITPPHSVQLQLHAQTIGVYGWRGELLLRLYALTGKELWSSRINAIPEGVSVQLPHFKNGMAILRAEWSEGTVTKQISLF